MKLQIKDRLFIPSILPRTGTFAQFNLKKAIISKIRISDEEAESIGLKRFPEDDRIEWDASKEVAIEVEFTKEEAEYIKAGCEAASGEQNTDDIWLIIERLYNEL